MFAQYAVIVELAQTDFLYVIFANVKICLNLTVHI